MFNFYMTNSGLFLMTLNQSIYGFVNGSLYLFKKESKSWQLITFMDINMKESITVPTYPEGAILLFNEKTNE